MSKKNKTRRVCIALITDHNDNILMGVRNDNHKWTVVGGHAEKGEDPFEAMAREAKEEANIDIEDIQLVKAHWDKERNLLIYLFKIVPDPKCFITSEKDPDEEVESWQYVDPNEIKDELHVPLEDNVALKYWANN